MAPRAKCQLNCNHCSPLCHHTMDGYRNFPTKCHFSCKITRTSRRVKERALHDENFNLVLRTTKYEMHFNSFSLHFGCVLFFFLVWNWQTNRSNQKANMHNSKSNDDNVSVSTILIKLFMQNWRFAIAIFKVIEKNCHRHCRRRRRHRHQKWSKWKTIGNDNEHLIAAWISVA